MHLICKAGMVLEIWNVVSESRHLQFLHNVTKCHKEFVRLLLKLRVREQDPRKYTHDMLG